MSPHTAPPTRPSPVSRVFLLHGLQEAPPSCRPCILAFLGAGTSAWVEHRETGHIGGEPARKVWTSPVPSSYSCLSLRCPTASQGRRKGHWWESGIGLPAWPPGLCVPGGITPCLWTSTSPAAKQASVCPGEPMDTDCPCLCGHLLHPCPSLVHIRGAPTLSQWGLQLLPGASTCPAGPWGYH